MSRETLTSAVENAITALSVLADELKGTSQPAAEGASANPPPRSSAPAAPPNRPINTGECPKHGVPWEQGNYGPYCKQMTDDPAWGKPKTDRDGNPVLWCKLTPKNAPDWVRIHGLPA